MTLAHVSIVLLIMILAVLWHVYVQPRLFRRPVPKGFDMSVNDPDSDPDSDPDPTPPIGKRVIGGLTPSEKAFAKGMQGVSPSERKEQSDREAKGMQGVSPSERKEQSDREQVFIDFLGLRPRKTDVFVAPPESSVNDVHLLREQDQTIAQLARHYEDMAIPPWKITPPVKGTVAGGPKTTIGKYSQVLANLMNPVAAAGSQRGNTAKETLWYFDMSPNKVWSKDETVCKALHADMNRLVLEALSEQRKRYLGLICEASLQPMEVSADSALDGYSVSCGQTIIALLTQTQAEALCKTLNDLYLTVIKGELDRVCAEIRAAAGAPCPT